MDSLSVTSRSSEHWLTIMTCTVCEKTPDSSPLYRCSLGHMVCGSCLEKLARKGTPRCKKCSSTVFKQRQVSNDFLRKLKAKPGIGRPRRYQLDMLKSSSESGDSDMDDFRDDAITLEKLFQLSTEQMKQLFDATAREKFEAKQKLKGKSSQDGFKCTSDIFCIAKYEPGDTDRHVHTECGTFGSQKTPSTVSLISKKPIACPHGDCSKVVTISSFFQHFKHEHADIPTFAAERSKELHLIHDIRVVEFDTTYCMAVIKLYEVHNVSSSPCSKITSIAERFKQKVPVGTFWLMVSGSGEERKSRSYVVYWLMTNTDEHFTCTLEMSSSEENISTSTFCSVNSLFDSRVISEIANGFNCLYLCYASVHNLLEEGPRLHFRVTVH